MRAVILAILVSLYNTGCMAVTQGEGGCEEDINIADNNCIGILKHNTKDNLFV